MRKIAVISDIHSHLFLFEKAVKDAQKRGVNEFIFLGDCITDGPGANEVLHLIKSLSKHCVYGNRELSIINYDGCFWDNNIRYKNKLFTYNELSQENKDYLAAWPMFKTITIENKKIFLTHASPWGVKDNIGFDNFEIFEKLIKEHPADIYLFGHRHIPFYTKYRGKHFINPGSINTPLDGQTTAKYGIITIADAIEYEQINIKYDFEKVKNYYVNSDYFKECPEWSNLLIYALRDGVDYRFLFISFLEKRININNISEEDWHKYFVEFMAEENLSIIK